MTKLFIGNLSFDTAEATVRATFGEYGNVLSCQLATDRDTGRSKGFAFVEYATEDEAFGAIQALNGHVLEGRALVVEPSKPKGDRPARDFSGAGGRGGGYGRGGGQRGRW